MKSPFQIGEIVLFTHPRGTTYQMQIKKISSCPLYPLVATVIDPDDIIKPYCVEVNGEYQTSFALDGSWVIGTHDYSIRKISPPPLNNVLPMRMSNVVYVDFTRRGRC